MFTTLEMEILHLQHTIKSGNKNPIKLLRSTGKTKLRYLFYCFIYLLCFILFSDIYKGRNGCYCDDY